MTNNTQLTGLSAVAAGTLTWLLLVGFYFARNDQPGRRALRRYRDYLDARMKFLRMRIPGLRIAILQLTGTVIVLVLALLDTNALPLIVIPIVALGPRIYLERLTAKRVTDLEAQTEPWLVAIANALKASPSLGEAIGSSVALIPAPMCQEVDLMIKEYGLGSSLDSALEQFAERIGSRTLSGAVLALKVARNSGGNLPAMLENAAAALRELARLEGVVRTKTAEGKAQAFVIGAIPAPMVLGIHCLDGHFFDPLMVTFAGHLVIGAAVVLWVLAILLALKILAVDI